MIDLYVQFKSVPNLFLTITLAAVCVFWAYRNAGRNKPVSLVPFTDFWQHHSPLLWATIAPVFKIIKPTASIIEMSRLFSGLVFAVTAGIGWKIARKVWRKEASGVLYIFLILSASALGEFLWLRPDIFMNLFLMAGLYFSLSIPGRKIVPSFMAGAVFALALSFTFKQYPFLFLPVIILFLEKDRRLPVKLLLYILGMAAGSLPLLVYLIRNHITREFFFWVFTFNRHSITAQAAFPVAVLLIGAWGVWRLFRRFRGERDLQAAVLCCAFCLNMLGLLPGTLGRYYLGFWLLLCAILGCSNALVKLPARIAAAFPRALLTGGFLVFLLVPNFIHAGSHIKTLLCDDKKTLSRLISYCTDSSFVGIVPMHPVFCRDATRLYSEWQFEYGYGLPETKKDIRNGDIAEQIMAVRPAVIQNTNRGSDFFLDLFQKNLVSKNDITRLSSFLAREYSSVRIGRNFYYVRRDALAAQEGRNER